MLRRLLLGFLLCLLVPASAPAATQMATVTETNDGDTLDVRIDGQSKVEAVRFIGVQAMELSRYSVDAGKRRGPCHAVAASNLVEKLVRQGKRRVRLIAENPRTDSKNRLFRRVEVRVGGRWRDVGAELMRRGLTLWMHTEGETSVNRLYNTLGQQAMRRGIGLWNTSACGRGPAQDAPLKLWVMSDPLGEDSDDVNAEWIKIQNQSTTTAVPLAGWWVRDSGLRRYTFGPGVVVHPGQTITVHSGSGTDSAEHLYWGMSGTIFENSINGGDVGDGAYLFDPRGDLRSWLVYPCLVGCGDPLQGAVRVTANPDRGPEYVVVRNVADRPIDLYGYQLRLPGAYAFAPDTTLAPGQALQVFVMGSPAQDTRSVRHAGYDGAYLKDSGGAVSVSTFDEIVLDCDAWGSGRC